MLNQNFLVNMVISIHLSTIRKNGRYCLESNIFFYISSAQIENESEKENTYVELMIQSFKDLSINKIYDYQFITKKRRWAGFDGVQPKHFEKDPERVLNILNTLNEMNTQIIKFEGMDIFHFGTTVTRNNETRVIYFGRDPGFVLKITQRMANLLGFQNRTQFEGQDTIVATQMPYAYDTSEKNDLKATNHPEKATKKSNVADDKVKKKTDKTVQAAATSSFQPPKITVEISSPPVLTDSVQKDIFHFLSGTKHHQILSGPQFCQERVIYRCCRFV